MSVQSLGWWFIPDMANADGHILLIDDDPDVHHAVQLILESSGYSVAYEATASAGWQAVERHRPDLILLDIMLASPTEGLELADRLKAHKQFRSIPIIMISSIGQQAGLDLAREAAADSYVANRFLEKPFSAQTLLTAVQGALEARD